MRRNASLPVRGAWIEILIVPQNAAKCHRSLPVRGAWIEIPASSGGWCAAGASLPVRGAWIEITHLLVRYKGFLVAPRAGSVD